MKHIIHIYGASGSGTSTLGRALAEALTLPFMDTDDYFWLPTDPPFTQKRPMPERLAMMRADIAASDRGVVISGSLTGWGDPLTALFTCAIRVITPTAVRLDRLHQREYARFGSRICAGGDMYAAHQAFLDWAAQYDTGDVSMRSKACHDDWERKLSCPILRVNGTDALPDLVHAVRMHLWGIRPMVPADADAIFALWLASPGMGLNTADDSAGGIARFLRRNPNTCFVAELDGQLTGTIMAGHDGRRGYIYHTCVRGENRRAGYGRALVETTLEALRREGIHKVALVAFDRNRDGNSFWERMGFHVREDLVYRDRSLTELVRIDP